MFIFVYVPYLITLFNMLPIRWYVHEISTSGGLYLLAHHLLILCLLRWLPTPKRRVSRYGLLFLTLVGIAFYGIRMKPFYFPTTSIDVSKEGRELILFYSNVREQNTQFQKTKARIKESGADLVALLEADAGWLTALNLSGDYPYSLSKLTAENFSIALFSKFPFGEEAKIEVSDGMPPVILAPVVVEGREIFTVVLHTQPPMNSTLHHRARVQLRRISTMLRHKEGEMIVVGDFNSSPFSKHYYYFRKGAELQHAWWGRGLVRTWNARVPLFFFMIDHVMYRGDLQVVSAERLKDTGSDHFPLQVKFFLPDE